MTPLERSIVQTVAYFDLFDFPLTYPELYRYLWQAPQTNLSEVIQVATTLPQLTTAGGLIMLAGREQLARTRAAHYVESEMKFNKRRRLLKLFSLLPGVQAIFLVNTMAYHNVRANSDIDLLIVAPPHKIWAVRFYTTMLAKLLRVRPQPNQTKDSALCLSFYATPAGLTKLPQLRISDEDAMEAYWLAQAFPIYDPTHTANQFVNSTWLKTVLPNTTIQSQHSNWLIRETWMHKVCHAIGRLLLWNRLLKQFQLWIMPQQLKQLSGPLETSVVVLTDDVMKFHTHDPRPELMERWRAGYSR